MPTLEHAARVDARQFRTSQRERLRVHWTCAFCSRSNLGGGAAGFALAIAGWIHERSWRARTGEALLATLAVVALGPILGQVLLVSLVIAGAIGVVMLLFWFSD